MQFVQIQYPNGEFGKVDIRRREVVAGSNKPFKGIGKTLHKDKWRLDAQTGKIEFLVDMTARLK